MSKPLIIRELHKTFNPKSKYPVFALKGINLTIEEGTVCGIIGPNGAGKTTLIRALLGFVKAEKGNIEIFGKSADNLEIKQRIGYQADNQFRSKKIRVREYLEFHSMLLGIKNNKEQIVHLLESFHMTGVARKKLSDLSKGMRQKIELISAFLGTPNLVILDEPTAGLDPPSVFELRDFILTAKREGMNILFSSHNLTEVEKSCDRVIAINNGLITGDFTMKDTEPGFLENVFMDRKSGEALS